MQGRRLNTAALIGLIGRGALGWDALLADSRYFQSPNLLRDQLGKTA